MYTILYVDDEPNLLQLAKVFLEQSKDFQVDTAISAEEGLRILSDKNYDAVISDYLMPEMDGIAFLKLVREKIGEVPFILFTGRGREDVVIEAINSGADFYLQKGGNPVVQFAELSHKIRQAIRRKKAESDLAESRDFLNLIYDSVRVGIVVIDATTHEILDLNLTAETMIGFPREEILHKICHQFICPAEKGSCPITDLHKEVDNSERILLRHGSEKKDIIKYVVPFSFKGRHCLLETFIDNTDRKSALEELQAAYEQISATEEEIRDSYDTLVTQERALRESEEKYRLLTEVTVDIIFMLDQDGAIVHVSPQICRYGYDPKDVLNRNFTEFIEPEDTRNLLDEIQHAFSTKKPSITVFRLRDRDGNYHWIEENGAPLFDCNGNPKGVTGIMRDITERKQGDDAVRQINLITDIAVHDVQKNIDAVLGNISSIEERWKDPALTPYLGDLESGIRDIQSQIDFILTFRDLGKRGPQWFDPGILLASISVPDAITFRSDVQGYEIFASPLFEKVFLNLLDNSLRHAKRLTEIRVSCRSDQGNLILLWQDNGVGIPWEKKEKIFERGVGDATGLGLSLIREILSLTGITILETGEPGKGARFEILVPKGGVRNTDLSQCSDKPPCV